MFNRSPWLSLSSNNNSLMNVCVCKGIRAGVAMNHETHQSRYWSHLKHQSDRDKHRSDVRNRKANSCSDGACVCLLGCFQKWLLNDCCGSLCAQHQFTWNGSWLYNYWNPHWITVCFGFRENVGWLCCWGEPGTGSEVQPSLEDWSRVARKYQWRHWQLISVTECF